MDLLATPVTTAAGEQTTLGGVLAGRSALIVNVASKCGLTPQYAGLQALQEQFEGSNFTVLGFPCNQFGGQEPGTEAEIVEFCSTSYAVTFPLLWKVDVNGSAQHPVWAALTAVPDAEGEAGEVRWNFEKFVIAADGSPVARFRSLVEPQAPELTAAIETAVQSGAS